MSTGGHEATHGSCADCLAICKSKEESNEEISKPEAGKFCTRHMNKIVVKQPQKVTPENSSSDRNEDGGPKVKEGSKVPLKSILKPTKPPTPAADEDEYTSATAEEIQEALARSIPPGPQTLVVKTSKN